MSTYSLKTMLAAAALALAATGIAHADCESDLRLLETALAAPDLTSETQALLEKAGQKAASALRKDDDQTCNKIVMEALAATGSKVAVATTATDSIASASLGDLSAFRKIAGDTLVIVGKGDLVGAKMRIKDLETAWDQNRDRLKPMNPQSWDKVDKSIDAALRELRASTPSADKSASALNALIVTIDSTK
jgi:hypothetical protein